MNAPVSGVARIPAELSALDAAPLMCAGLTTFNALRHCGIRPGDLVAVQGIGGLGHLGIQFARRLGARVVAVSRGDDKRALALELGAHDYVDGANDDAAAALRGMGGARVILATAPNAKAVAALAGGLGLDGTLMIVAAPGDPVPVSALTLISTRGSVRGWASGTPADSEDTMKVAVLEGIRPTIETYPLSRAEEAYGRMMSSDVRFRAVLIPD